MRHCQSVPLPFEIAGVLVELCDLVVHALDREFCTFDVAGHAGLHLRENLTPRLAGDRRPYRGTSSATRSAARTPREIVGIAYLTVILLAVGQE